MTKKPTVVPASKSAEFKHSPFAALASHPKLAATLTDTSTGTEGTPSVARAVAPKMAQPIKPVLACHLRLRHETAGRAGKVVTRIAGLPLDNLEAVAARLRKGLGCGATVEGNDVLLMGSLAERATQWLERAGDLRKMTLEPAARPPPNAPEVSTRASKPNAASSLSGTNRGDVRRGQRVAIVTKADQPSGALTEGIVRDLLTNSDTHPRGIKVRLETGEIGRVQFILDEPR